MHPTPSEEVENTDLDKQGLGNDLLGAKPFDKQTNAWMKL